MQVDWASLVLSLAVGAAGAWWLDARQLRRAASIIDTKYKSLDRPPRFEPLGAASDIPAATLTGLDAFDARCVTDLGFTPLGRLREYSGQGILMGVRTVLVDPGRTLCAAFACSHEKPERAFRAFASELPSGIVCATDAPTVSPDAPRFLRLRHAKTDDPAVLWQALRERLATLDGPRQPFDTLEAYLQMQDRAWHYGREARLKSGNIIEMDTLRRLSTKKLSERRLQRLHAEIVRLNRG